MLYSCTCRSSCSVIYTSILCGNIQIEVIMKLFEFINVLLTNGSYELKTTAETLKLLSINIYVQVEYS
jgi:hypothetical protein